MKRKYAKRILIVTLAGMLALGTLALSDVQGRVGGHATVTLIDDNIHSPYGFHRLQVHVDGSHRTNNVISIYETIYADSSDPHRQVTIVPVNSAGVPFTEQEIEDYFSFAIHDHYSVVSLASIDGEGLITFPAFLGLGSFIVSAFDERTGFTATTLVYITTGVAEVTIVPVTHEMHYDDAADPRNTHSFEASLFSQYSTPITFIEDMNWGADSYYTIPTSPADANAHVSIVPNALNGLIGDVHWGGASGWNPGHAFNVWAYYNPLVSQFIVYDNSDIYFASASSIVRLQSSRQQGEPNGIISQEFIDRFNPNDPVGASHTWADFFWITYFTGTEFTPRDHANNEASIFNQGEIALNTPYEVEFVPAPTPTVPGIGDMLYIRFNNLPPNIVIFDADGNYLGTSDSFGRFNIVLEVLSRPALSPIAPN